LLDELEHCLDDLGLTAKVNKCANITFMKGKPLKKCYSDVSMLGTPIVRVSGWKYLGILMSEDLSLETDVERMTKALMKQFHSCYGKFSYLSGDILNHLFRM